MITSRMDQNYQVTFPNSASMGCHGIWTAGERVVAAAAQPGLVQRAAARTLRGVSAATVAGTVAGDGAADSEGIHSGSMAWIDHGLGIKKGPFT